jgi:hypothetical protein
MQQVFADTRTVNTFTALQAASLLRTHGRDPVIIISSPIFIVSATVVNTNYML